MSSHWFGRRPAVGGRFRAVVGVVAAAVSAGSAVLTRPAGGVGTALPRCRGGVRPRYRRTPGSGTGQAFVDGCARRPAPGRSTSTRSPTGQFHPGAASTSPAPWSTASGTPVPHIESTAANCPNTRIVLGGYSQGAALAGTSPRPRSRTRSRGVPLYIPQPMPPEVANHVAAVVLFGEPSGRVHAGQRRAAGGDRSAVCAQDHQPVRMATRSANGAPQSGAPTMAHALYNANGMTGQAAAVAVQRL